ncbi:MAG: hypothetical protein ACKPKO_33250, partial [Candidatus Fonsibacter sp.]
AYDLKKKEQTQVQQTINLGEYKNFGQTVQHLGGFGWPTAVEGAKKVFMKAAKLGGIWCNIADASELMMSLVMRQQRVDIFEQRWSLLLQ